MKRVVKPSAVPKEEVEKFNANQFVLDNILFKEQLEFVQDPNPFKVAVCSRRAGKTVACAAHLVHTALANPDSVNLYITLSGVSGKRIIWREFKKLLNRFNVKAKVNDMELSLAFPNGAMIYIAGAKDTGEIEKFRGLAIKLCYIDECQSFRSYIQELIDDIIAPGLMDYAGSLCLIGTPGPVKTGYFWECWNNDNGFSKHHWLYWQNPFIPVTSKMTHQQVFDREMKRRGITDINTPSVQREWFGKWENDTDSLLIKYDVTKNDFKTVSYPHFQYNYIMGIDVGFNDADAICILAWHENDPSTYLVEELVTSKQGLTELVQQIQTLNQRYKVHKMVMDMGGLGLKMGEEMIRRHSLPVEAADKARKMENVELLNDALRSGRFKAKANSVFAQDSFLVEVDRDKSTPDRIKVSDRYHSDIIDSVLYAFKLSPAFASEPALVKPVFGSKEWAEQQSNSMFEAELNGLKAEDSYYSQVFGKKDNT